MIIKGLYIILFLIAIGLYSYSNQNGLGLTNDSRSYLYAAKSYLTFGEMLSPGGERYSVWPTLFPSFLILIKANLTAAKWMQIGFSLATLGIMILLGKRVLNSDFFRLFFFASLVFSAQLIMVGNFLWSEPAFIFLLAAHIYILRKYILSPDYSLLFILIVIDNLLCLQRLIGISFVFITFLTLIFYFRKTNVYPFIIYAFTAILGFVYWYIEFSAGSSQLFYYFQIKDLIFKIQANLSVLGTWILPRYIFWLGNIITLIILIYGGFNLFGQQEKIVIKNEPLWIVICGHFLFYLGISVAFPAQLADFERYLTVIFPMFFLLLTMLMELIVRKLTDQKAWIYFLLLGWLCYPVIRTLKNVIAWNQKKEQRVIELKAIKSPLRFKINPNKNGKVQTIV